MKQLILSLLIFFFYFSSTTISQNQEWINYTNGDDINAIEMEGDFVWVGTDGGLVKIDRITGNSIYFDKINSGLPSNYVNCIAIDELGNKWIGAQNGLVKFDGTNWTVYNSPYSNLDHNRINCLAIDEVGNKWIGTPYGLVKYDGTDWSRFYSNDEITCLTMDKIGNLWVGAEHFLAKFDGTFWGKYDTSDWISSIAIDDEDIKWIGVQNGLVKFDGTNWHIYNQSNSEIPIGSVGCIEIDLAGNVWLGIVDDNAEKGLVKFDGENWDIYNGSNSGLPGEAISCITVDEDGNKWIGSYNIWGWGTRIGKGLIIYDDTTWTKIKTSSSGLTSRIVNCLAIDKSGNKWIGCGSNWPYNTDGADLVKFDGKDWTSYDQLDSPLRDNVIRCITSDNLDNQWIGTGEGLVKFDGEIWDIYNKSNSDLSSNRINCITIDESGIIWIGTSPELSSLTYSYEGGGLVKYDGTDWITYDKSNSDLSSNIVSCIAIDELGNKWIGTEPEISGDGPTQVRIGGGLVKYNGTDWTIYDKSNSDLPSNSISCIVIDEFGNKWIGTWPEYNSSTNDHEGGGLAKFDGANWTIYNESNSELPSNWISCIAVDNDNDKWIGGYGLVKIDGTDWQVYDESNSGLSSNSVTCIEIDNFGNKWIGTDAGLAVFNEDGVVSVEENKTNIEQLPTRYELHQNYPNPFNPNTTISYSIPQKSFVSLKLYDALGAELSSLVDQEKTAGNYEITFDGSGLSSGIYFYRLKAGDFVETKKMILMK